MLFRSAGNGSFYGVLATGSGTLSKTGAGSWFIVGSNTYSGATTIGAGTVQMSNNFALGRSSAITLTSGATLDLNGANALNLSSLTLAGTGTSGMALTNSGLGATYSGAIVLSADTTIGSNVSSTLTLNSTINGGGFRLTLNGSSASGYLNGIISNLDRKSTRLNSSH